MSDHYITNYTGVDIDRAVAIFNSSEFCRRVNIIIPISQNQWTTLSGSGYKYYIDLTLKGYYNVGDYPLVYFLDGYSNRFTVDYMTINTFNNITTIRVYSNVKQSGQIVEVANLSSVPSITP